MTTPINPMLTPEKNAYRSSRRERVADMYLRQRLNQEQIAFVLKVDQSTISRDIKFLMNEWQRQAVEQVHEVKARDVAELESLESEAASKYVTAQSERDKIRWLETRLRIKDQKADLLGLKSTTTLLGGVPDKPLKIDDINAVRDERWRSIEEKLVLLASANGNGHKANGHKKKTGVRANGKV